MTPEFKPVLIYSERRKDNVLDIYTETPEQNELFKSLQKLISSINELKEQKISVYVGNIIQATQGALTFDYSDNTLKANHFFILSKVN